MTFSTTPIVTSFQDCSNTKLALYNDFTGEDQSTIHKNKKGIKYVVDKILLRRLAALYNVLGDIF